MGFDGSQFSGWQRQKTPRNTVQEVIENTLSEIFKKEVSVYGCGRTDAGVHASQYIMQIYLEQEPEFDLKFRLNKRLPNSIAVFEIMEVEEDQHCRYNATARTYDYFIHFNKDPNLIRYSLLYENQNLDYELMKKCTELIAQTSDFRALCKQPDLYKNTLCRISQCTIYINEESGRLRFSITSNRFLRGMIRYCVFFLLEVGSGKMTWEEFESILKDKNDQYPKRPALPQGLFLSKIEYPFIQFTDPHPLIKMLKVGLE